MPKNNDPKPLIKLIQNNFNNPDFYEDATQMPERIYHVVNKTICDRFGAFTIDAIEAAVAAFNTDTKSNLRQITLVLLARYWSAKYYFSQHNLDFLCEFTIAMLQKGFVAPDDSLEVQASIMKPVFNKTVAEFSTIAGLEPIAAAIKELNASKAVAQDKPRLGLT